MTALKQSRNILLTVLAATVILFLSWVVSPSLAPALMAMPDIGINYQTMKVTAAENLAAAGMKRSQNGDGISLRTSPTGQLIIKNLRTNEEMTYPPE